jgi:hypothetical protein
MNKPESGDMIIKVGDSLIGIDSKILIQSYDPEMDKYAVVIIPQKACIYLSDMK